MEQPKFVMPEPKDRTYPLGYARFTAVHDVVVEELFTLGREYDEFAEGQGIFRMNPSGEYVSAEVWEEFWSRYPLYYKQVCMLWINDIYSIDKLVHLNFDQIQATYDEPYLDLEEVYYTEHE